MSPPAASAAQISGVYVIADDDPRWKRGIDAQVDAAIEGGASALQLRLKHTGDGRALETIRRATRHAGAARAAAPLVIVNDRFDLALLGGAAGVHLGQDDLAPSRIPAELRARLVIGRSTHTRQQLETSRAEPIDYVAFGPVFATGSKTSDHAPRGLEALRAAVSRAGHPLVAIGGIGVREIEQVAAAGAAAAAVISVLADAVDPVATLRELARGFAAGAAA